ncbi:glutamic acid-rich protein-like isoform X2 [Asterias rubens]|uniref:glutamic acid-rich protein-like isoform X2 n=1 Tax=Asterias rubens TaxID=7604 RepID=UPI001455932C|nr:glutamic acid-rich protein-like isoform X2 [Asterias rubens]
MRDTNSSLCVCVQMKQREDYFNRQRVENEFDSSGKGIHTTTPLVVQLELSYLQAAEQQWKAKKKVTRQKNLDTKQDKKETQKSRDGDKSNETELSPRIKKNSKLKSRVKGSEIERITKNAQTTMSQVSVNRIHSVHRYRPHLTRKDYVDLGKVAHVSPHVNAILNTEYAWKNAEDNDDREAARKYVQEKMESQAKEKEEEKKEHPTSTDCRERTPEWLRVQRESPSNEEIISREPDQERDGVKEDSDDASKNDKTRRHDDSGLDDESLKEDQDNLTSVDDRQDTTSGHLKLDTTTQDTTDEHNKQDTTKQDTTSGHLKLDNTTQDTTDEHNKQDTASAHLKLDTTTQDTTDEHNKQDTTKQDTASAHLKLDTTKKDTTSGHLKLDTTTQDTTDKHNKQDTTSAHLKLDTTKQDTTNEHNKQDTTSLHDKGNEVIESGERDDAFNDNLKDDKQDVERENVEKEGDEQAQESDIKEHEDRHQDIPDDKDELKTEEYVRTESMLSLTTVDNS